MFISRATCQLVTADGCAPPPLLLMNGTGVSVEHSLTTVASAACLSGPPTCAPPAGGVIVPCTHTARGAACARDSRTYAEFATGMKSRSIAMQFVIA